MVLMQYMYIPLQCHLDSGITSRLFVSHSIWLSISLVVSACLTITQVQTVTRSTSVFRKTYASTFCKLYLRYRDWHKSYNIISKISLVGADWGISMITVKLKTTNQVSLFSSNQNYLYLYWINFLLKPIRCVNVGLTYFIATVYT